MLLVFLPIALIASTFYVSVGTIAVCFIVEPLAIIDVAISMKKFALPACLVILPFPFIASIVRPAHGASSVSEPTFPLASIDCSGLVGVDFALQRGAVFKCTVKGLFSFITLEILALYFTCHFQYAIFPSLKVSPYQGLESNYGPNKLFVILLLLTSLIFLSTLILKASQKIENTWLTNSKYFFIIDEFVHIFGHESLMWLL